MSSRILTEFDLLVPRDIPEALEILGSYREQVTTVAGGTDLLVAMKSGYRTPYAMSLAALPDLDYLSFHEKLGDENQGLRIGARTTVAQLLESEVVKECYPALWQAAKVFATSQIKNTATVVGNLLRGSPAGDCSCAVYALGGELLLASLGSERLVSVDDLWIAYGETACAANELALELRLPPPVKTSIFKRLTRTHEDLAKLNVAVNLTMDGDICRDVRLVMGCVGPTLMRLKKSEALLRNQRINDDVLTQVMECVREEITPIDDKRSTADYRRQVAGIFLKRAILQACEQA